jgi:hypothetical protein
MSLSSLVAAPLCATPPLAARGHRHHRRSCVRVHAARPPSGPAGDDGKGGQPKKQRYEVKVSTPPERSLGIHTLPKNVGCGETIEVLNRYFVAGMGPCVVFGVAVFRAGVVATLLRCRAARPSVGKVTGGCTCTRTRCPSLIHRVYC